MSITKVLITANHKEDDDKRIFGPATYLRDFLLYPFYYEGLLPIVFPAVEFNQRFIKEMLKIVDLLILTGGGDVDPLVYGEEVRFENVTRYQFRDKIELMLIKEAINQQIPIFGICRGLQIINVFFGGSLYQNIKEQISSQILHWQNDIYHLSHNVAITPGSFLAKILNESKIFVNSFHHQAVKKLGKGLKISAKSADGIIEAIAHSTLPIFAVQWHPEVSYVFDNYSKKIIKFCRDTAKRRHENNRL